MTEEMSIERLHAALAVEFTRLRPQVIQPAEGYLRYPYLIPAGFYKQMWDWDGFFMGNHFVSKGKPQYLKYWARNLLAGVNEDGYVSGCATTDGPRELSGAFAMKPFLSQGVWFAATAMNDFTWVKPHYQALMKVLSYRDATQLDTRHDLYYWDNAMQSGADNNPALNYLWQEDHRSFLACDASTFQLRELLAQAAIATRLGYVQDAEYLRHRAATIHKAINRILWCKEDQIYYNVNRATGLHYRRVSYASFVPLMQKLAPQESGVAMIKRYLIEPSHMKATYGLRSLSARDIDYNNRNMITPFSNWQGPVWPIANYIYSIALKHYGFDTELTWLAFTLGNLLLKDIQTCGSMHENYHADTGEPLAPSDEYRNEDGSIVGFISWNLCMENLLEGVVYDRWMLLEI